MLKDVIFSTQVADEVRNDARSFLPLTCPFLGQQKPGRGLTADFRTKIRLDVVVTLTI